MLRLGSSVVVSKSCRRAVGLRLIVVIENVQ